jgi:carbonic anhydrase/acetyltransferase-like protein (isoleucine patch superfamily)
MMLEETMVYVLPYRDIFPKIEEEVFLAPGAWIIGDVEIGPRSSIWFNAVVRGDVHSIKIGSETNIQDGSVLQVTTEKSSLTIGDRVTIGNRVVVHACVIEDECWIGSGALILDGARIGKGSLVAAGTVIPAGFQAPPGSLVMGTPATIEKTLSEEEHEEIRESASKYVQLAATYIKPHDERKVKGFLG